MKTLINKLFKKQEVTTPKTELYVQVTSVEQKDSDVLVLTKIGHGKETVSVNILDLPENIYRCNAYKITIEPIEHTFEKPCQAWKEVHKPDIIDIEAYKDRMKKMFGVVEDEEMIEI